MKWSWSSSPTSSWTQWILPVNRLVCGGVVGGDGGAGLVADVGGLVGGEDHRLGGSTRPVPTGVAVVVEGDVAALGQPAAVVGELHAHLVACRRGSARRPRWRTPGCRARCRRTWPRRPWRTRAQPPNRPPWAMITPSAPPSGTSTSAVTENDLFLMLTTLFSESRPMPGKNSWELPADQGRPPGHRRLEPLRRCGRRCGSTLYLVASISHSRCSLASRSGVLGGEVAGLAVVGAAVVELPHVVVEGGQLAADHDPRGAGAW